MSETNGTTSAEKSAVAASEVKMPEPMAKKSKLDDSVEDRDFDEETQKALEEIDANQNEIDALNERKQFSKGMVTTGSSIQIYIRSFSKFFVKKYVKLKWHVHCLDRM